MNYGYAQNLIPNPSFEDTICVWPIPGNACWDYHATVGTSCVDWYAPAGSLPDYFHVNYNEIDSIWDRIDSHGNTGNGVPNNFFGNNIYPRTGNAYAGISTIILFTHEELDTNIIKPCFGER